VLGLGLGRAILFLRQHDAAPYRDIILNACVHWTGYDQQLEGTRTNYLRDVLDATEHEQEFVKRILPALKLATDRHDATQLAFLARSFAEDGYDESRTALYEKFDRNDAEEPFLGSDAIIRLDGLEGFLYVAERMGAAFLNDPDAVEDIHGVWWEAEEAIGQEEVRRILTEADTPALQAFARALEEDDETILVALLTTSRDPDDHHEIGMGVRHLMRAQPSADAGPAQLAIYEYGPCSFCRKMALRTLHKRGQVPDWMLGECLYDASLDIREAADAWARGEEPAEES
jgi:hypothetical protein